MARKKKVEKNWYGDVTVTVRARVRVSCRADVAATNESMLEALNDGDFYDITDEETFEYLSVEELDGHESEEE